MQLRVRVHESVPESPSKHAIDGSMSDGRMEISKYAQALAIQHSDRSQKQEPYQE